MFHKAAGFCSNPRAITLAAALLLVSTALPAAGNAVQWLESPLAGADDNHDGVRDDVAARIRANYQVRRRHWPMEIARAGQRLVLSEGNPFAIYRAHAEMQRALRCIAKGSGVETAEQARDDVLQWLLDNEARRDAYLQAVTLWETDVQHRNLPSRPDDRWQEGCGDNPTLVRVVTHSQRKPVQQKVKAVHKPRETTPALSPTFSPGVVVMEKLPPPNFFLTGEKPETGGPARHRPPPAPEKPRAKPRTEQVTARVVVVEERPQLPEAFQVKPRVYNETYSEAFGVSYAQAAGESSATDSGGQVESTARTDQEEEPVLLFDSLARGSEDPPDAKPESQSRPLQTPPIEVERIEVTDQQPAVTREPQPPEPEQATEVADNEPASLAPKKAKEEVVVVVKKGKAPEDDQTQEAAQSEEAEADSPGLPPELRNLAPFIKSYSYQ